ncbi:DUF4097 family beta strand repeat-containing protein [Aestuariimicrobium soli]|uniref:DUF4097 family beta strand repeat-containing protein n=1 Tax=Aestuariimicrobium soli TaxID=2035834 RepID=UPI003EB8779A
MTSQHTTFAVEGPIQANLSTQRGDIVVDLRPEVTEATVDLQSERELDLTPFTPTFDDGQLVVDLSRLQRAGWFENHRVSIKVTLPADSGVRGNTGQGDISVSGRLGGGRMTTGQGDVTVAEAHELVAKTGSGDISVQTVHGTLELTTGSGDISVAQNSASVKASTGSGDITLARVTGDGTVNTGSGDITITTVHTAPEAQAKLNTGSGDITVRELTGGGLKANTAAGDITIGVRPGIPVWTDVNTLTGRVSSNLQGAGQPREGADHLEIRATTVTGDISLRETSPVS